MIALTVATVVAVGGGQLLEARATSRVAEHLASSTAAASGVDVDLSGFPVAVRAAAGRVPQAVIEIEQLTTREPEVTFTDVVLDLRDLRFGPFDVAVDDAATVTVGGGSATAILRADELTRLAAEQDPGWRLRSQDGQLVASGNVQGTNVRIVADVAVVDGALRLTAREVAVEGDAPAAVVARAFDRSIGLPELPGRVRLTEAEVAREGVRFRAVVRGVLDLGA